jgi:hypothetical protein
MEGDSWRALWHRAWAAFRLWRWRAPPDCEHCGWPMEWLNEDSFSPKGWYCLDETCLATRPTPPPPPVTVSATQLVQMPPLGYAAQLTAQQYGQLGNMQQTLGGRVIAGLQNQIAAQQSDRALEEAFHRNVANERLALRQQEQLLARKGMTVKQIAESERLARLANQGWFEAITKGRIE